jgi:hypothetical protein
MESLVAGHTKRRRCPKNTHSLWFTCIERALNGFLDIQDAYNAPQAQTTHPPPPNESVKNRLPMYYKPNCT